MTSSYAEFLRSKAAAAPTHGIQVEPAELHPVLHEWQKEIVTWAAFTGRAAIWADTGLGKTVMLLEWARVVGDTVLVIAPLAVCHQTTREAKRLLELTVRYVRDHSEVDGPGVWITNTEMVGHFDPAGFDAVVLDESSILKNSDGATRTQLIAWASGIPRRLACTATPGPNDVEELTNHAEWLGVSPRTQMLAAYFVHDSDGWRVKGHARRPMMRWMASWAIAVRRPSDLGYADDGYVLPGLDVIPQLVQVEVIPEGQLFATDLGGVGGRAAVRRSTLEARCARAADLVAAEPDEPWLLWCGLNDEAVRLAELIPGAVNIHGGLSVEAKADALLGFADGRHQVVITKPSMAAFGLNYQHCARMAFVGLSDSMETYYQAIRRCYRYGQTRRVHAHVVLSELEQQIAANVARKERDAARVMAELVTEMRAGRTELQEVAA